MEKKIIDNMYKLSFMLEKSSQVASQAIITALVGFFCISKHKTTGYF